MTPRGDHQAYQRSESENGNFDAVGEGGDHQQQEATMADDRTGLLEDLANDDEAKLNAKLSGYQRSDYGNAMRVIARYGNDIRYAEDSGTWYVSDGTRYVQDVSGSRVNELAGQTALDIERCEAPIFEEREARDKMYSFAIRSQSASACASMVRQARRSEVRIREADLDRQPHLVNFTNGTYDLERDEFRAHDPRDMLTLRIPHAYNPDASGPMWDKMIARGVDHPLWYTQMAYGYAALWGGNPEAVLLFPKGPTKCAKSKSIEIIRDVLGNGDYGVEGQPELITSQRFGRHDAVLYNIKRSRFVAISETNDRMDLDENQVKRLTGNDQIPMRALHQQTEHVSVTWTICIATNEPPNVENFDDALRERVIVLPFGPTLPPDERWPWLPRYIVEHEAEAVLAWLVEGARAWYAATKRMGSPLLQLRPESVITASERYAAENDVVLQFADDRCIFGGGQRIKKSDLWDAFRREYPTARIGKQAFYARVEQFEGVSEHRKLYFDGVDLRSDGSGFAVALAETGA